MISRALTEEEIWLALDQVMDPEIPVISLVELGIIRQVESDGLRVTVHMTPTFSGCPALVEMKRLIEERLAELGAAQVVVENQLAPPWTSDWISPSGRQKMRDFGLAPPAVHGGQVAVTFFDSVACPYCGSSRTRLTNSFGSTLCRATYTCLNCSDAFEQFKAL